MIFDVDKPGIIEYTAARKLIHSSLIIRYLRGIQVKCWNRPVTISPFELAKYSDNLHLVKCWNRPVTISPPLALAFWEWSKEGEVLEQTSYYITHDWFARTNWKIWVKCWNRPVTISPIIVMDIPSAELYGEVLEQTSYYITRAKSLLIEQ